MSATDDIQVPPRELLPTIAAEIYRQDAADGELAKAQTQAAYWKARWDDEVLLGAQKEEELADLTRRFGKIRDDLVSCQDRNALLRDKLAKLRDVILA